MSESIHEICRAFPLLTGEDMDKLVKDIHDHGLREPIVRHEGSVIDGQNRLHACRLAGVTPRFVEWDGQGSLADFVVSKNLARRHLTTSQRAMIAVRLEPFFAGEAKSRQEATRAKPGQKVGENVPANLPPLERGEAREKAAKVMKVSPRSVSNAKKVAKTSPELAEKVTSGEMTLAAAMNKTAPAPAAKSLDDFLATLKPGQRKKWDKLALRLVETLRSGVLFENGSNRDFAEFYLAEPLRELLALQPSGPIQDFVRAARKLVEYLGNPKPPGRHVSGPERNEVDSALKSIAVASGERACAYSPEKLGQEPGNSHIDRTLPYPDCQGEVGWQINRADENAVPRFLCDAHKEWAEKTSNSVWRAYSNRIAG